MQADQKMLRRSSGAWQTWSRAAMRNKACATYRRLTLSSTRGLPLPGESQNRLCNWGLDS